jgi:hypothetical protein
MEFIIYLFSLGIGIGAAWLRFRAALARRYWIILTLGVITSAGIAAAIWLPANDGTYGGVGYALVGCSSPCRWASGVWSAVSPARLQDRH